jgi:hypothetical protein
VLKSTIFTPLTDIFTQFGSEFHDRIESANSSGFGHRRAARYLAATAETADDGVQRYWIYICLGELSPDELAFDVLRRAIAAERDEFAVVGAREALSRFPVRRIYRCCQYQMSLYLSLYAIF